MHDRPAHEMTMKQAVSSPIWRFMVIGDHVSPLLELSVGQLSREFSPKLDAHGWRGARWQPGYLHPTRKLGDWPVTSPRLSPRKASERLRTAAAQGE